jgi:uncharacterized membrane protein YhhN
MAHLSPIPFLLLTVPLLVRAELERNQGQIYVLKPLSTLLVIAVSLLSLVISSAQPNFTLWIALGLTLSLGGDVALMFESRRAFMIGLVLFLLTHVVYSLAFTVLNGFHAADIVTGAVLLGVGAAIFFYLRPGLGSMKVPVILYIFITCFMVNRAISTFFGDAFTTTQAWLISLGAISFMFSDIVLAVNRFHHPMEKHRLSLFPYFLGQLLIALSPSYFG